MQFLYTLLLILCFLYPNHNLFYFWMQMANREWPLLVNQSLRGVGNCKKLTPRWPRIKSEKSSAQSTQRPNKVLKKPINGKYSQDLSHVSPLKMTIKNIHSKMPIRWIFRRIHHGIKYLIATKTSNHFNKSGEMNLVAIALFVYWQCNSNTSFVKNCLSVYY